MVILKGITELIVVIVIILIIAISLLIARTVNNKLIDTGSFNNTYLNYANDALGVFDPGMIFIVVGFIIAMVIGAFMVYSHPVFAVPYMIIMIFIVIIAAITSNVFSTFSEEAQISTSAAQMPMVSYVFTHLPLIFLVGCVLVIIVLYGKQGGGGMP